MTFRSRFALVAFAITCGLPTPSQSQDSISFSAGVGIGYAPTYTGADTYDVGAAPLLNASYGLGNAWNSSVSFDGALRLTIVAADEIQFGLGLGYGGGRDSEDADRFAGLPDVENGPIVLAAMQFGLNDGLMLQANTSIYTEGSEGWEATLGLGRAIALSSQTFLQLGVSATWTNEDRAQGIYGVTSAQAAASVAGLSAFNANAGITSLDLSATLSHQITSSLTGVAILGATGLIGAARNSPFTERALSPTVGIGLIQSF